MRLQAPGLRFRVLPAHRRVSQYLGGEDGHLWHIAVAAAQHPSDQPLDARTQLQVFTVPPRCIIKLHPSTWHAGPLFEGPTELVFCNLELRDTHSKDRAVLPLMEGQEAVIRP